MFERKPDVTTESEALWEAFGGADQGALIRYADIEKVTGHLRYSSRGRTLLEKFRRRLLKERDVTIRCVSRVGIELLTNHAVVARIPAERTQKIYRQGSKMLRETAGAAAASDLRDHERATLAMSRTEIYKLRRDAGRQNRALTKALEPTKTLPRRS